METGRKGRLEVRVRHGLNHVLRSHIKDFEMRGAFLGIYLDTYYGWSVLTGCII